MCRPHPRANYSFLVEGKRKQVRYQYLDVEHKQLYSDTLNETV